MDDQEIEGEIACRSLGAGEKLTEFRANREAEPKIPLSQKSKPMTLADALGDLIGAGGRDKPGSMSSSRDAGEAFTDYLVQKKRDGRL